MAVATDPGNGPFTCEELFAMTIQAGCVFGKLRNVGERRVAFANVFPVFGRELVTRTTGEFFFRNVCGVRKVCVVDLR